ncbi:MAG TPA: alpha/beta hydrolase [Dongiaceae bacterium]|nr:alpha/beta hydrolase [Dongiaceae bacterium]
MPAPSFLPFRCSTLQALNVRDTGEGTHALVLAHGFGTDQRVWAHYTPWLAERYRVITYDLPCAGAAEPSYFDLRRHGSLDGHAEDLISILDELGISQCTLLGHSASGMIGVLAAIAAPERFERLILLGASARYLDAPGYHGGFDEATVEAIIGAIGTRFREWAATFGPYAMDLPIEHPAAESFVDSILRMRPSDAIGMAKAIFMSDYRDVLPNCRVPVTVLQTRQDPAVPIEAARYLAEHLPRAELEVLDVTGHLPHLSAPQVIDEALHRHLARFARAAP